MDKAESYVGRVLDGKWDAALVAELKRLPEEERARFLREVLHLQEKSKNPLLPWFSIANNLIGRTTYIEDILRAGLVEADASTIRAWLDFGVVRLGMRRLIRILQEYLTTNPDVVDNAEYWLPTVARTDTDRESVRTFIGRAG